jgi:hypothetical protein
MNQPEPSNLQSSIEQPTSNSFAETNADNNAEVLSASGAEWFPEDDDDWYEPDYCKNDRRSS